MHLLRSFKLDSTSRLSKHFMPHQIQWIQAEKAIHNQRNAEGHPTSVVEQVKVGVIKFDNGSRIMAFSPNPQAMAVYGGDVGLDEFAKHPNAKLLWETAQGRITLGHDLAI